MKNYKSYLILFLTFFIWGSLYVVSKFVLGKLPTFTIAFLRYLFAFITLSLFSIGTKEKINRKDIPYFLLIGVVGYFISVDFQLLGIKYAGSSLASLINSTNPIFISIMAALLLGERMTKGAVCGLILSVAGVFVIIGVNTHLAIGGLIFSFIAVLLWSLMSVSTRKLSESYSSLTITRIGMLLATICNLPVAAGEIAFTHPTITVDLPAILSILYLGVVCTGIANLLWNRALSAIPAHICSSFYPFQTLTSSILGVIFLNETITHSFIIGTILIIIGVLLSLMPEKTPSKHSFA